MKKSISFIGAGRVTNIFLQALKNENISLKNVSVFDTNNQVSEKLKLKFPEITITNLETVSSQDVVFLSLHPPVIMETLGKIKDLIKKETIIISLAPKITIEKISLALSNKNVIRLIPNATSIINEGYNPVCFVKDFPDKSAILELLSILGKTFETDESKLEAYAITSAMLPTYFWFQWYEMIEIAKQIGLSEKESSETIEETLVAALKVMFTSGLTKDEVIDLIPVKPIGEYEVQINEMYQTKLIGLFNKIKP